METNANTVMNFSEYAFKKVECTQKASRSERCVTLQKKTHKIRFSSILARECGMESGDRVDIYENGRVLAVKKDPVGCLVVRGRAGGNGFGITSLSAYLAFAAARPVDCKNQTCFAAWVDENGVVLIDMGQPMEGLARAADAQM